MTRATGITQAPFLSSFPWRLQAATYLRGAERSYSTQALARLQSFIFPFVIENNTH